MFLAKDWLQGWCWLGEKMVEEQEELVRRAREEHWAAWGLENSLETLVETPRDPVTRQGVEVIK